MVQILSVAPVRTNRSVDTGILYGYTENILKISNPDNQGGKPEVEEKDDQFFSGILRSLMLSLIGIIVISIVGGYVILRSRKKKQL
jgi:hypothetical protein